MIGSFLVFFIGNPLLNCGANASFCLLTHRPKEFGVVKRVPEEFCEFQLQVCCCPSLEIHLYNSLSFLKKI
jgi:hypothetical protein